MLLGVNDGLVSSFLLVAGVAGGGMLSQQILLIALAGALAGAISMCAGEYVATKSQNEVMSGEIALEKEHISLYLEDELMELADLLTSIGIAPGESELKDQLIEYYRNNPAALLKIMTSLEFGVVDQETRSPIRAGLASCSLFLLGALPSVLPFAFSGDQPTLGLIVAAALTTVGLMVVGAVKTWATRGNCLTAALENLVIAGCGGSFAYAVGLGFQHLVA
jgi:VIT1/CCC1 family predicted Fe2+/Mn2+ transporter